MTKIDASIGFFIRIFILVSLPQASAHVVEHLQDTLRMFVQLGPFFFNAVFPVGHTKLNACIFAYT